MSNIDPRICRVTIVLVGETEQRTLTSGQTRTVLDRIDEVAREAAKWTLSSARPGRLLLLDQDLVAQVEQLLDSAG